MFHTAVNILEAEDPWGNVLMRMPAHLEEYLRSDTIFAPASGAGRAAIAIVRISGPAVVAALQAMGVGEILPERVATLRTLRDPQTREALDRALILRFCAPHSFTGEQMAELHLSGGRAVLAGIISALGRVPGLRLAEPGEFASRAFENGKLDLSEVEGLADLVAAETAARRRQALRIAGGALSRAADRVRALLLHAMSAIEAQIDFSDIEEGVRYRSRMHGILRGRHCNASDRFWPLPKWENAFAMGSMWLLRAPRTLVNRP